MERAEFASFTLLLVGEKNHSIQIVRSVLSIAGIGHITHVTESERAIELLSMESFGAVICEYQVAPVGGLPFAIAARRLPGMLNPLIPIFVLRERAQRRDVEKARDIGANDFLTSPISPRTVITKLRTALNAPRPFIVAPDFFGPDRRAKVRPPFQGEERRTRAAKKAKIDFKGSTTFL